MKTLKSILIEAVSNKDIARIVNKYLNKAGGDPTARGDLLMQVASLLGRTSSVSPEQLDVILHKSQETKGQNPAQRAGAQNKQTPPPLPGKPAPGKPAQSGDDMPKDMPSLSQLATRETDPVWKKHNLPNPDELEKSKNRGVPRGKDKFFPGPPPPVKGKDVEKNVNGAQNDNDEELPTLGPKDFKMVGMSTPKGTKPSDFANQANKNVAQDKTKKAASDAAPEPKKGKASKKGQAKDKEVDMKTFGDKKLSKKKDKPENSEPAPEGSPKKKKKEKDSDETSGKKTPMPSFSSIAKPMLTGKKLPQNPKWKIGKTVDLGHAGGGYKVVNKTGSWYNLERNGEKYVFIPFKGLRKIS